MGKPTLRQLLVGDGARAAVAVLAALFSTGCPAIVGLAQDYSAGDAATSDATDATTGDAHRPPKGDAAADSTGDVEPDVPPPTTCKSTATECVAAPPAGWTGPLEIYNGDPATAPTCPSPLREDVSANTSIVSASPVTCSPCACVVGAIACGDATFYGSGLDCSGCDGGSSVASPGKCTPAALACGMYYVEGLKFDAPPATASCTTTGGSVVHRPPVRWMASVVGCKAPSSALERVDCSSGEVCAPRPTPPFDSSLCVFKDGDVACPGAPYAKRSLVYAGVDDARDCSACSCDTTPGVCTGKVNAFSDSSCKMPFGSPSSLPSCLGVYGSGFYAEVLTAVPPATLACSTAGGQPQGKATPASPVTLCCL